MNPPQQKNVPDLNGLLVQSMDETITGLLGEIVLAAFYNHLNHFHSIQKSQVTCHLDLVSAVLNSVFGSSGRIVERMIAANYYSKLGLECTTLPNQSLNEYFNATKKLIE